MLNLKSACRVMIVLVSLMYATEPVIAQPAPVLLLQADLLGRRTSDGSPPAAVGVTAGAQWHRAALTIGVKATALVSPPTGRGRLPSDEHPDVLQAFPHVDVGLRVLERGRFRLDAIGGAGPWINVVSRNRDDDGRLRSFSDVEYRAVAATVGAALCWRINTTGRRLCGSGSTLHHLPGFGRRSGSYVGPLFSVSVTR